MPIDPDVLVGSMQELMAGNTTTFDKYHPVLDRLVEGKQFRSISGPYVEFVLVDGGPGQVTVLDTGEEEIRGGRNTHGVRGNEVVASLAYAFDVNDNVFRDCSGKTGDIAQLVKDYPMNALTDFKQKVARQLIMGTEPDMGSMVTLNGDATYNPRGYGARNGLILFQAPSAQSAVVHGVASNSITGWYNQYQHISSFSSEGKRKMRKLYYECQAEGSAALGDPDVILADPGTFDNYVDNIEDSALYATRAEADKGTNGPKDSRKGVPMLGGTMYREQAFSLSSFVTANAQLGVGYVLNTQTMQLLRQGMHASAPQKYTNLEWLPPVRHISYAKWRYEMRFEIGLIAPNRRTMGAFTGGNNP